MEWDRQSLHSHHSTVNAMNAMNMNAHGPLNKPPSIQGSHLYAPAPFQDALSTTISQPQQAQTAPLPSSPSPTPRTNHADTPARRRHGIAGFRRSHLCTQDGWGVHVNRLATGEAAIAAV